MQKYIKTSVIVLGFAMLFAGFSSAEASFTWNGASNDCATLSVANYTTNSGFGSPCWNGSSVSASAGDYVNVRVYYHNGSDLTGSSVTATNTRVTVNTQLSSSVSHTVSGQITSDQGSLSFSGGNINLSSAQSLDLTEVRVYFNQSTSSYTNYGSEILSSGISLGSIAPGWNTQGSVVLTFHVSSSAALCTDPTASNQGQPLPCSYPPATCTISSFVANPASITSGQASVLSWGTNNCTNVNITTLGNVQYSSIQSVYPTTTTSYTINASNSTSTAQSRSVTVTVSQASQCAISSFNATPSTITSGQSSSLNWSTTNCTSVNIIGLGNVAVSGTQSVYPTATTTYTLNAVGSTGAQLSQTATVAVSNIATSGTITATPANCVIPQGSSSCNTVLTWNTNNPVGTSAVTKSGGATIANGNSGTYTASVSYSFGATVFYLYNSGNLLDQKPVSASCTSGATWDGSVCAQAAANSCVINSFTASPSSISSNQSSTLAWSTSNCNSANITNIGNVVTSSSQTVTPAVTTSYTLTALGSNNSQASQVVSVTVANAVTTGILTATTNCIVPQGSSTCTSALSWSTSNPVGTSAVTKSGGATIANGNSGSYTATLTYSYGSTIFYLYNSGNLLDQKSVTTSCTSGTTWDGSTCALPAANSCVISNFTASPTVIYINNNSNNTPSSLSWNTTNCNSVSISSLGSVANSGSQNVYPQATTTYTLNAYGANGIQQNQSVTVTVNNNNYNNNYCTISYFNSSQSSVTSGSAVTLSWSTSGCTSTGITNLGSVSSSGSQYVYPQSTTSYTLNAYGQNGGYQTQTVQVYVNNNNNYNYNYNYNNYNNCTISYFTATPVSVPGGLPAYLSWNTSGCTSVSISGLGSVNLSGTQNVYPSYTTNYILSAYGYNNNIPQTQSVQVNVGNNTQQQYFNACAVTTVATNVTKNSATFNGLITNPNGGSVNSYFEYGTTVNLGSTTPSTSTNGAYSYVVSGLAPDTIYFYRSVSNCSNGLSYGKIEILNTQANAVTSSGGGNNVTVIRQGTTVIGTSSPILLKIENHYQSISVGDTIDYTITYKNIGKVILKNSVLQVVAPKGITLTNSSAGTYSKDTNTLTVSLGDLIPDVEGSVYVKGIVDSIPDNTAQIVTTAILVYTNPNGAQENAIAYVLNNPKNLGTNNLGAAAFFGGFFSIGLIGWLLLIILILLLILIIRNYYQKQTTTVHTIDSNGGHTTTTTNH